MTWSMSQGDPVLGRQTVGRQRGRLGRGLLHEAARRRPPGRPRVVEPVGIAFVAVERRRRRVQREDRLPESFGEGVDGRGIDIGIGHG